jgi:hypothetical protein
MAFQPSEYSGEVEGYGDSRREQYAAQLILSPTFGPGRLYGGFGDISALNAANASVAAPASSGGSGTAAGVAQAAGAISSALFGIGSQIIGTNQQNKQLAQQRAHEERMMTQQASLVGQQTELERYRAIQAQAAAKLAGTPTWVWVTLGVSALGALGGGFYLWRTRA